jgi:Tfp pilus assembly protein PilV
MKIVVLGTHKAASSSYAFSLVEVMIGVLVMAIMMVGFYLGFSQGFAVIQVTRENLRAAQILEEKMETIRLFTWPDLNAAANPYTFQVKYYPKAPLTGKPVTPNEGITYYGTRTITNAPVSESYSKDLKLVIFQLTWTSGKVLRQREMRTLVSHYGMRTCIFYAAK